MNNTEPKKVEWGSGVTLGEFIAANGREPTLDEQIAAIPPLPEDAGDIGILDEMGEVQPLETEQD